MHGLRSQRGSLSSGKLYLFAAFASPARHLLACSGLDWRLPIRGAIGEPTLTLRGLDSRPRNGSKRVGEKAEHNCALARLSANSSFEKQRNHAVRVIGCRRHTKPSQTAAGDPLGQSCSSCSSHVFSERLNVPARDIWSRNLGDQVSITMETSRHSKETNSKKMSTSGASMTLTEGDEA